MHRALFLACVSVAAASGGCARPTSRSAPPPEPEVVFFPQGAPEVRVAVEVARTEQERNRGLMYRDHLAPGRGMLFLFDHPHDLVFWMRNTYIPLDMIFLDPSRRVVGIVESAVPLTDDPRHVDRIAQYVVEVPGGWAAAHRIAPGVRAEFLRVE